MTCFDVLGDPTFAPAQNGVPDGAAEALRNAVLSSLRSAGIGAGQDPWTDARDQFRRRYAVDGGGTRGGHKRITLNLDALDQAGLRPETAAHPGLTKSAPLAACIRIEFNLVTPLFTRDDAGVYIYDNPVRKDRAFGIPFLSAAAVKGFSADAYQRGFPPGLEWGKLSGGNAAAKLRTYRRQDRRALRLFGTASDKTARDDAAGVLRFSPVWFNTIQYLVMNPRVGAKARGSQPIVFEAIAPGQTGIVEVRHIGGRIGNGNDENTVREDLACWLAAVAAWWPALGLGAKRLAGYGAIKPCAARLWAKNWLEVGDEGKSFKGESAWSELAKWLAGDQ